MTVYTAKSPFAGPPCRSGVGRFSPLPTEQEHEAGRCCERQVSNRNATYVLSEYSISLTGKNRPTVAVQRMWLYGNYVLNSDIKKFEMDRMAHP